MYIKSPIFYMGNKYDLLYELLPRFPLEKDVDVFVDLFGGSGTVSMNVPYKNIIYNELNQNIVNLLSMIKNTPDEELINHIESRIKEFNLPKLSCDVRVSHYTDELKNTSSDNYLKFRKFYNSQENKDYKDLYTLTFFSFCNLIRFNSKSEFNMPFGNRCFLEEHKPQIRNAHEILNNRNIQFLNMDAFELLSREWDSRTFIYLDPPYSNTTAIYNENRAFGGWSIEDDERLFNELDKLSQKGIKWAMSNVFKNKGKENNHIKEWAIKNNYKIIYFEDKNYASLGKGNAQSQEIMICNYQPPFEKMSLFDLDY